MTGNDLMKWIKDNHAEDYEVMVSDRQRNYLPITLLWESEARGGTIMIDTSEVEKRKGEEE